MNGILSSLLLIWLATAWFTHVVVSIQSAKWVLLVMGTLVFPISCVHGTGVWFGVF